MHGKICITFHINTRFQYQTEARRPEADFGRDLILDVIPILTCIVVFIIKCLEFRKLVITLMWKKTPQLLCLISKPCIFDVQMYCDLNYAEMLR